MSGKIIVRAWVSILRIAVLAGVAMGFWLVVPRTAQAHCDTLDGPVVLAAKRALETGDVKPVLKWVKEEYEEEIRSVFSVTLTVRAKGPEARKLAELYFFETLVRLHRLGEGAPYTGLKPAGTDVGAAVAQADEAMRSGRVEAVVKLLTDDVAAGIHLRFLRAFEKKQHAEESVEAGREFVEAYVEFVHYVQRLHLDATAPPVPLAVPGGIPAEHRHQH